MRLLCQEWPLITGLRTLQDAEGLPQLGLIFAQLTAPYAHAHDIHINGTAIEHSRSLLRIFCENLIIDQ
jgi:hypothetical protein